MIRPTRILLLCGALAVAFFCAVELSNRFDTESWVLPVAPLDEASRLAAEGRWAEVKMLADFVVEHPHLGDQTAAEALSGTADVELSSFQGKMRRFAHGAATGEPTDGISMLGSLSLDLFVIGDIRDLAVQGWKQMRYGDGDTVILALSAVGLATTLAPHLDWAPALMKALKRTGAFTQAFLRTLKNASRTALRTGDFSAIGKITGDIGRTARRLGPGPLRGAMRSVDSAEDLAKIAKASEVNATGTYAIARLFGNGGVKRISKDGKNVGKLITTMKAGSRLAKITKKSLGSLPTSWLVAVLAAAMLIVASALWPRRRRRRKNRRRLPLHERSEPDLGPYERSASARVQL